jgi:hypothetical protein
VVSTIHKASYLTRTGDFLKMAVFWVVAPCSLVEVYGCFKGACCLRHQGRQHGATTQKTAIFILAAVRISNQATFFPGVKKAEI